MLINISDQGKGGKRTLTVSDDTGELYSHAIDDVAHGHRLAKIGLAHGWDSDELAAATKK